LLQINKPPALHNVSKQQVTCVPYFLTFKNPSAKTIGISSMISDKNTCGIFYDGLLCLMGNNLGDSGYTNNYFASFEDAIKKNVRRGDLVSYDGHVSIVYKNPDIKANYQIVHAYGINKYTPIGQDGLPQPKIFSRKVLITGDNINTKPLGFGRVKLWD
jgi:hypothetical protein